MNLLDLHANCVFLGSITPQQNSSFFSSTRYFLLDNIDYNYLFIDNG